MGRAEGRKKELGTVGRGVKVGVRGEGVVATTAV